MFPVSKTLKKTKMAKEQAQHLPGIQNKQIFVPFFLFGKKRILLLPFLLMALNTPAQSLKSLLKQGEVAMKEKDYFAAAQIYNRVIRLDSLNPDFQYKYAEASRLNYDIAIAEHWYRKVYIKDNGRTYPEVTFWLGEILKSKAAYKEAKKMFNKFLQKNRRVKDESRQRLAQRAKIETEACELAQVLMRTPLPLKVEHLDTSVNSKVSEYAPIETDSLLYFSSLRNKGNRDEANHINYNKLYLARRNEERWTKATELDSIFNLQNVHTANTCFNHDHTRAYITRCEQVNSSTFSCVICVSEYNNGHWTAFRPLPEAVNAMGSNNTQPNIGWINKEEVLFFSSNRSGGKGGQDIWYCRIDKNGNCQPAVNAGEKINSPGDEICPFFVHQLQSLYFSSDWHKGMGGFDIFRSVWKQEFFAEPENAGYPVNSPLNDVYYSINSKNNRAYLSSNRLGSYFEEKQSCCNDIYSFAISPLEEPPAPVDSSQLLLQQMKVLVPLTLYFHNDEPEPRTKLTATKQNYKSTYENYTAMRNRYEREYTANLSGDQLLYAENRITNFFDDSVDAGMHDLDRFATLLEKVLDRGEHVKITMKGYCSPLASTDYNINLAKRRVCSLQNYFREYKNGLFLKYIDNNKEREGSIIFLEEDIGELPVSKVSDDVKDTRNSVYSPYAAAERKIQIIAVSYGSRKE